MIPVPSSLAVYALTVFCAVVVVLTRWILGSGRSPGHGVSPLVLGAHTGAGLLGTVVWTAFILIPADGEAWHSALGAVGLGAWWVTGWFGVLLLGRWLPSRGRHSDARDRRWFVGLTTALVGHVGVLVSGVVFTLGYLFGAV
ncbi:hypothetical protein [Nocardioides zeae]